MSSIKRKQRKLPTFLPSLPNGKPIADQKFALSFLVIGIDGRPDYSMMTLPEVDTNYDFYCLTLSLPGKTAADAKARFEAQITSASAAQTRGVLSTYI